MRLVPDLKTKKHSRYDSESHTEGALTREDFDICALSVAGPKTWNALPEDVTSSQSEYTFRRQLKTWLFKKSFPDIIT